MEATNNDNMRFNTIKEISTPKLGTFSMLYWVPNPTMGAILPKKYACIQALIF